MKFLLLFLLSITISFSKTVDTKVWEKGQSFLTFLNSEEIPHYVYFNLSKTDKELCTEIIAGIKYQIVYDEDETFNQVLIPITEETQIHIYKDADRFKLEMIPVIFDLKKETLIISTKHSPYLDILNQTNNKRLAHEFVRSFQKTFNFRRLQPEDKIIVKYEQKIRMGNYYGTPLITAAYVNGRYDKKYIFQNPKDGRYYDDDARSLTSVFFKVPLKYSRISSKFSLRRLNPVTKKYRPHLGVDYAAPRGRAIVSTADGKIVYRGRKGGYGNVIEIVHPGGYKSLYAHMSKFNSRYKRGSRVKQGNVIGYVGTTGRSTGPHLHFGLYKNGRAINPQRSISYSTTKLKGFKRTTFFKHVKSIKSEFSDKLNSKDENTLFIKKFDSFYSLDTNSTKI